MCISIRILILYYYKNIIIIIATREWGLLSSDFDLIEEEEEGGGRRMMIGDYEVGERIGSGSFAVVYKSRHIKSGMVVAIKEIDKKHLLSSSSNNKLAQNLLKEISILSNIRHPNIIRLFESIQTMDRIYLVLEYCDGGDLAAYLHRHPGGKLPQPSASHFMRQLASGLQVLKKNHLIHRDLKPQNLLLSNEDGLPLLKIGDFGFARYLTPQGLADTLCGSPLYMAPEIIQNKPYDSKADLWSAGAILYQLVTGKPPFNGNSQLQLFQNILTSGELQFPQGTLDELHPDCINLCRSLLRRNPVERITFEEFFNHKFLEEPGNSRSVNMSIHGDPDRKLCGEDRASIPSSKVASVTHRLRASIEGHTNLINQTKGIDLMDSIEKDYVFVNAHFASSGSFCSLETSQLHNSTSKIITCQSLTNNQSHDQQCEESGPLTASSTSTILQEVHGLRILHPSTRLQLLHQYLCILSDLAQKKFISGLFLESFAIELVVLAIWREAIRGCGSWLASTGEGALCGSCSPDKPILAKDRTGLSSDLEGKVEFGSPQSVSMWAEHGFIAAFDRTEKLSTHVQRNAQMPDAMDIIFQTALEIGRSGGVDELMGNKGSATTSYSKAKLLLSFIMDEAESLPLNPPFSLTAADRERIKGYIRNFESRQSLFDI